MMPFKSDFTQHSIIIYFSKSSGGFFRYLKLLVVISGQNNISWKTPSPLKCEPRVEFQMMESSIESNITQSLVQVSRSVVSDSVTSWTAARQASLSITKSRSLLKLMSIESVMTFNHLILCHPLLLQPSIFPNIRVFSNDSVLHTRWPKYWSFSFNIVLPVNIQD